MTADIRVICVILIKSMLDINTIFNNFTKVNVLIIGDVMIDRYWQGKVNRISPEAPVPVVEFQKSDNRLGGAANVALNVKALGATPYLFSVIGVDTEGLCFSEIMNENGLSTQGILKSKERVTTVKTRIMAGTQQILRVDNEMTQDISEAECLFFVKKIKAFIRKYPIHVIILQDYNKGVLSASCIESVLKEARKQGIPTVIDPKKKNFLAYKGATLFKPNLKEIREALPFEVKPEVESLQKAANYLREHIGQQYTMITLSDKGLYLEGDTEGGAEMAHGAIYPTQARNIADVSGAGDTVVSIAALSIASNLDKKTIALLSNLAGGQVCEIAGVVPVDTKQLLRELILCK